MGGYDNEVALRNQFYAKLEITLTKNINSSPYIRNLVYGESDTFIMNAKLDRVSLLQWRPRGKKKIHKILAFFDQLNCIEISEERNPTVRFLSNNTVMRLKISRAQLIERKPTNGDNYYLELKQFKDNLIGIHYDPNFFCCIGLTWAHGRLGKCGKIKEMTSSRPSHPGTL